MKKLSLKRELLTELTAADLRGMVGGTKETTKTVPDLDTLYSCMTFVSCAVPFCLIDRASVLECIVN